MFRASFRHHLDCVHSFGKTELRAPLWRPQGAAKTRPRRPKTFPRRPQDAPRRPQDGPRRPQGAPKTPQDAPETALRQSLDAPRPQDASKKPQDAPKTSQESENDANMEPSWHENPAQINAYADNLEDQKKFEKAMKDKRKLTTVRRAQRASERAKRAERSGGLGSFAIQNRSKRLPSGNEAKTIKTHEKSRFL